MNELLAGAAGGIGLFVVGMRLLTENLKALASRRLRRSAARWTGNPVLALAWGMIAGGITQSMAAVTFIVVSTLRSGLINIRGAFALILGAGIGVCGLVVILTFSVKIAALYVLGIAGTGMAITRRGDHRAVMAACLGGALIVTGLVLLQEAAAPLAREPWFHAAFEHTGGSLLIALALGAALTALVQSSGAVSVFGISLSSVGVLSVDQAIMVIYGSMIGSSVIVWALSAGLTGRSRQVPMYTITQNVLICTVVIPLLYAEIYAGVPLMKALVAASGLGQSQQLALVYVLLCAGSAAPMLATIGWTARVFDRLWPTSQADALALPKYIHTHASVDVSSSLRLVELEQRSLIENLSAYFEAVRRGTGVREVRDASRHLLHEIGGFLDELQSAHPTQGVEEINALRNGQKVLTWLEDALGTLCETLEEIGEDSALAQFRTNVAESVDSVLLALNDAMSADDAISWELTTQLTGERGQMMREIRLGFVEREPKLSRVELIDMLLITNAVEESFFLLSKLTRELRPGAEIEEHVPKR